MVNMEELARFYDDLDKLSLTDNPAEVENVMMEYSRVLSNTVDVIRSEQREKELAQWITNISNMMSQARRQGRRFSDGLDDLLRTSGGLDLLLDCLTTNHSQLRSSAARLLQEVLASSRDNKIYVVDRGLDRAVSVTKVDKHSKKRDVNQSRVATEILESLFDHSEETCGKVMELGGLQTLVEECKSKDPETLRHCASALANAAIYSRSEQQAEMMKGHVPQWLFTLLLNQDITIKYYACLALAILAAYNEIAADIQKTDSFRQIRPILAKLNPTDFSEYISLGKSKDWLLRLLPVLNSELEESKTLAAFHFAMEAEKMMKEDESGSFEEIGAIDILKEVASSPNGTASQYAAQALRTLGQTIPYSLSQQVVTWNKEDVREWLVQKGFSDFTEAFLNNRVDGDLLLQISEQMLEEDILMKNGILRRRFLRKVVTV